MRQWTTGFPSDSIHRNPTGLLTKSYSMLEMGTNFQFDGLRKLTHWTNRRLAFPAPLLLQCVPTQRQCLEGVGQGSQGAASEWMPAGGGVVWNCQTPVCLKNEPAQTPKPAVCSHLCSGLMREQCHPACLLTASYCNLGKADLVKSCRAAHNAGPIQAMLCIFILLPLIVNIVEWNWNTPQ